MKLLNFILLLILSPSAVSQESLVLKEDMLMDLVKSGNGMVAAENRKVESRKSGLGHLRRSFVPKTTLEAGQETFKYVSDDFESGPYYKGELDVNLFNGGQDKAENEIKKIEVEKARSESSIKLFSQLEESRKVFWNIIYLNKSIEKLEEGLGWISTNRKAAIKRINSGVATNSDKFEFEIKRVEITQEIERAKLQRKELIRYLKLLLGLKDNVDLVIQEELSHSHEWKALLSHSEDEHEYLFESDKLEIQKTLWQSKKASRSWYPKVNGYAFWLQSNLRQDFDRIDDAERQQTVFGIKATWTISDFFKGNVKQQEANALYESKKMKLSFEKKRIENELHMELKELELLDKLVHEAEENINRSQKFFFMIRKEYRRGVKTSGDMLSATEKLLNSHIRMMSIVRDFQISKAHILRKLGK